MDVCLLKLLILWSRYTVSLSWQLEMQIGPTKFSASTAEQSILSVARLDSPLGPLWIMKLSNKQRTPQYREVWKENQAAPSHTNTLCDVCSSESARNWRKACTESYLLQYILFKISVGLTPPLTVPSVSVPLLPGRLFDFQQKSILDCFEKIFSVMYSNKNGWSIGVQ